MKEIFRDLPLSSFPFTLDVFDLASGELLDHYVVTAPGMLSIRGLGTDCRVVATFADGEVVRVP